MSTYIIGDTHGCLKTLRLLVEERLSITRTDTVYLLGDYIDRGPSSAQLVDYLIGLMDAGYRLVCLRGNHEQMLLDSSIGFSFLNQWMLNSGYDTLLSYYRLRGDYHDDFTKVVPHKHLAFIKTLPYYQVLDDRFILVHGGLNYYAPSPFTDYDSLLWKRPEPVPDGFMPGYIIFHGHTPTPLHEIQRNVANRNTRLIGLDAGCVYKHRWAGMGYLVGLNLERWELVHAENIDV